MIDLVARRSVPAHRRGDVETLRHLVASDRWNLSFFREGTEAIDEKVDVSLDELRSAMTSNGAAWMELLAGDLDPDADTVEIHDGWEVRDPVPVRLAQVLHHGTDHRSQIRTALTSLGLTPPILARFAKTCTRQAVVPAVEPQSCSISPRMRQVPASSPST